MRKTYSLLSAGVIVAVLSLSGVVPAAADDQDKVDEPATQSNPVGTCGNGWLWFPQERVFDGKLMIGPTQFSANGTNAPAKATFTSTVSGTFTAMLDGGTEIGLDAKLAQASAKFGASFQASMTAAVGNSIEVTVPPGATAYAEYGIWNSYIKGEEQHWVGLGPACNVVEKRSAGMQAPFRAGWDTSIG